MAVIAGDDIKDIGLLLRIPRTADGRDGAVLGKAPRGERIRCTRRNAGAHAAGGVACRRAVNDDGGIGKRRRNGLRAESTLLRSIGRRPRERDGHVLVQVKRRERVAIERDGAGCELHLQGWQRPHCAR